MGACHTSPLTAAQDVFTHKILIFSKMLPPPDRNRQHQTPPLSPPDRYLTSTRCQGRGPAVAWRPAHGRSTAGSRPRSPVSGRHLNCCHHSTPPACLGSDLPTPADISEPRRRGRAHHFEWGRLVKCQLAPSRSAARRHPGAVAGHTARWPPLCRESVAGTQPHRTWRRRLLLDPDAELRHRDRFMAREA